MVFKITKCTCVEQIKCSQNNDQSDIGCLLRCSNICTCSGDSLACQWINVDNKDMVVSL